MTYCLDPKLTGQPNVIGQPWKMEQALRHGELQQPASSGRALACVQPPVGASLPAHNARRALLLPSLACRALSPLPLHSCSLTSPLAQASAWQVRRRPAREQQHACSRFAAGVCPEHRRCSTLTRLCTACLPRSLLCFLHPARQPAHPARRAAAGSGRVRCAAGLLHAPLCIQAPPAVYHWRELRRCAAVAARCMLHGQSATCTSAGPCCTSARIGGARKRCCKIDGQLPACRPCCCRARQVCA